MTLSDAEKELWLREYVWAKTEWEKEVHESFPHLRLFKTGHAWDIYQFVQKLNKEDQLALAIGRLKQGRREQASKWGEHLSVKEESICRKFDAFFHIRNQFPIFKQLRREGKLSDSELVFNRVCAPQARVLCETVSTDIELLSSKLEAFLGSIPQSLEEQVKVRTKAGEKIKFVSKKKLQKIITQRFKNAFASQYVECRVDEGHWTAFDMKCDGWMLQTQFNFGRKPGYQQSVLGYWHNICSENKTMRPPIPEFGMAEYMYPTAHLCRCVRWPCSSEWEYLTEEDVELACNETFKYCRYFYEVAPRLLKGLEYEKLIIK